MQSCLRCVAVTLVSVLTVPCHAEGPPTGFQAEVKVKAPTRLDWEFTASGFGKEALKLPADYDSKQQRFQLFVPKDYDAKKAWPLVVFISPGDAPMGWRNWQKICEDSGMLFCSPYGAGNSCPAGQRIRIVLDMFDQVRRDYRIDPDQTYVTGFSGGGRVACTIGFHLPEFFGAIIPVCGTNPLARLDYLRHRAQDRISVALLTGATDFNRAENEQFMRPLLKEVDIRSRLWVVPAMGHAVPGQNVLTEVKKWIDEDLERRRADAKKRPFLACPPDDELRPSKLAERTLEAARQELKEDMTTWRGVTLLQGLLVRWQQSEAGGQGRKLLDEIKNDQRRLKLIDEQGGQEERVVLKAQAEAFESFGKPASALPLWRVLAQDHATTAEGKLALAALKRLEEQLAKQPYLGVQFAGDSTALERVQPGSPAARAGLQAGDRILLLGTMKVATVAELQKALESVKPGDKLEVEVERKSKVVRLTVEVGSPPK